MSGAISPLPNTPSWRGAQLKHRDNFTLPLPLPYVIETAFLSNPKVSHLTDPHH
jgi:hypothetical protein